MDDNYITVAKLETGWPRIDFKVIKKKLEKFKQD